MRCWWTILMLVAACRGAGAETIESVIDRSQQVRLAQRPAADAASPAAQRVRDSLARILGAVGGARIELVLVGGSDLFAEALLDRPGMAVAVSVGELPEGQRLLLLAHELGHVRLGHAGAMKSLYHAHIPGPVRREATDAAAATLGPAAHALSHRHELEADAFGYQLLRRLGFGIDDAFGLLTRQGLQIDSATHPGTRRRLAQLRAIDEYRLREAAAPATALVAAVPRD